MHYARNLRFKLANPDNRQLTPQEDISHISEIYERDVACRMMDDGDSANGIKWKGPTFEERAVKWRTQDPRRKIWVLYCILLD